VDWEKASHDSWFIRPASTAPVSDDKKD